MRDAAVHGPTDAGLVLQSVGVGKQDAKHRCGVQAIEVLGGEQMAQPVVDVRVLAARSLR